MKRSVIALGCALALATGSAFAQQSGPQTHPSGSAVGEKSQQAGEKVREQVSEKAPVAKEKASQTAQKVGEKTKETAAKAKEKGSQTAQKARQADQEHTQQRSANESGQSMGASGSSSNK